MARQDAPAADIQEGAITRDNVGPHH